MKSIATLQEIKQIIETFVQQGTFLKDDDEDKLPYQSYQGPVLVTCLRDDVIRILKRYLSGEYPAEDADAWAGGIHSLYTADLIDFEPGYRGPIDNIIHFLTVWGEDDLTPEIARDFIHQLQTAEFRPNDEP